LKDIDDSDQVEDFILHPGNYRIIDGKLTKLKSGLNKDEVISILKSRE
jgi:hypothetical protein